MLKTAVHSRNESGCLSYIRGLSDVLLRRIFIAEFYVISNGTCEEDGSLGDESDL